MEHLLMKLSAAGTSTFLSLLGPVTLLSALLIPQNCAERLGANLGRLFSKITLIAFLGSVGSAVVLALFPQASERTLSLGGLKLTLLMDPLSLTLHLLVTLLGWVVTRFSVNYLSGAPRQGRFFRWLAVTLGCVLTLLLSGNLLLLALAWVCTSVSLHQLLTFYPERRGALRAARLKFVISRLGDAYLLSALLLIWKALGTWDLPALFAALPNLKPSSAEASLIQTAGLLIAGAAIFKSAQFPFHSWLPDTMETPTPVSALMHAGIINAGGFLVLRMSPMLSTTPWTLHALFAAGTFTALFASVVMLTQTSIKRTLAYSTIAQMGFMMLECGVGAFALAVLHIVAHSLYKAHAFLSSGSTVSRSRSQWIPAPSSFQVPTLGAQLALVLGAAGLSTGIAALFGGGSLRITGSLLLMGIFSVAIAQLLWGAWIASSRRIVLGMGIAVSVVAALSYFSLHSLFERLLMSSLPHFEFGQTPAERCFLGLVLLAFAALHLLQSRLPVWTRSEMGRALYVHASNGFYIGSFADRLISKLLPERTA